MKILRNSMIITILGALLLGPTFAFAADGPDRYFIKTKGAFWKNSFGVRHNFSDGFTADLSDWQVRVGKMFGLEIEPVKFLFVLPVSPDQFNALAQESGNVIKGKKTGIRVLPFDQTPWGIETVYQDSTIEKTKGGKDIKIAVLDTGVTVTHPDLKARVKECKDFTNLRFSIVDGKCEDKNGHGTHVAGIIAADGGADGLGIYGIAPEVSLLAYRVCSISGSCYSDDVATALKVAADNGANIVNLSLGSDSSSSLIQEGVNYAVSKGVLIIAAAGNDGPYFDSIDYPAAYETVVGVGAFDTLASVSGWSSRGINSTTNPYIKEARDIEFAMPGVNIESTWNNGGYAILSGTSMASPHLAGLAAKYWQSTADKPADATRLLLRAYSEDINLPGDDNSSGWGFPKVLVPVTP